MQHCKKCSPAEALADNEMSQWSQNAVAGEQGGREQNQITGQSASTDKQPQAWVNWENTALERRLSRNVAQSGDDNPKDTSDSNWG